ncbi:MAG: PIN domain-containing protein [Candidatus Helarchaeota archaeon]
METYTVDTVALLAYFADSLPSKLDRIFKRAEDSKLTLFTPSIVIGELIYTIFKGKEIFGKKIPIEKIDIIIDTIQTSPSIRLVDMNIECWRDFLKLEIPELHDRMIVASHFSYKTDAILTNNPEMEDITLTIWS